MAEPRPLHLAVALDGTGFHPASWRDPSARPTEIFTAKYWTSLALTAERGLLDFVTIEDSLGLQSSKFGGPDGRTCYVTVADRGNVEVFRADLPGRCWQLHTTDPAQ